jgi:hypothetical protein
MPIAHVSRRQLLQLGGIGALGLSLPELLRAGAPRPGGGASGPERSCIFIVQYGGASHIDSLDPKPRAPEDVRGPYAAIDTRTPGLQFGELFPQLADMSDRFAVIRSMSHGNAGHDGGMHVAMTGHSTPAADTPYFGAVLSRVRPTTRNMPSYVWLQNLAGDVEPRYLTGGFLGSAYSPLRVGTDLDNPSAAEFKFTAFDPPEGTTADGLRARLRLLEQLDSPVEVNLSSRPAGVRSTDSSGVRSTESSSVRSTEFTGVRSTEFTGVRSTEFTGVRSTAPGAAFAGFQQKAFDLVTGDDARRAFDLAEEPDALRERYGRNPLGQNLLMARRLVESGVRLVSVTAWCGVAEGETFRNVQTWDMHGVGAALGSIFGTGSYGLGFALPRVDQSVSALLSDLEQRGLLDSTLVVMVGEFGRAPRVAHQGRDHWPACYSALLAGAGIRGGTVYGSSDLHGAYVRDNPVSPENFGATLFTALGIDPGTRLGLDGFTKPASAGVPVAELFG